MVHFDAKEGEVQVSVWPICMDTHDPDCGAHSVLFHCRQYLWRNFLVTEILQGYIYHLWHGILCIFNKHFFLLFLFQYVHTYVLLSFPISPCASHTKQEKWVGGGGTTDGTCMSNLSTLQSKSFLIGLGSFYVILKKNTDKICLSSIYEIISMTCS